MQRGSCPTASARTSRLRAPYLIHLRRLAAAGCYLLQDSNILAILGAAVSHPEPLLVLPTHARHGSFINLTLTTYHTLYSSSLPLKMSVDTLSRGEKGTPQMRRARGARQAIRAEGHWRYGFPSAPGAGEG
jgi:hypothetical protein